MEYLRLFQRNPRKSLTFSKRGRQIAYNTIDTMIDKERMVAAYIRLLEQREQRKKAARLNVQDRTLTKEEVDKILSYQPASESLERARFLFIIILHTGMRYQDFWKSLPDDLRLRYHPARVNRSLMKLADSCGIEKRLTFMMARHTFLKLEHEGMPDHCAGCEFYKHKSDVLRWLRL